jgi:hypothetical protein
VVRRWLSWVGTAEGDRPVPGGLRRRLPFNVHLDLYPVGSRADNGTKSSRTLSDIEKYVPLGKASWRRNSAAECELLWSLVTTSSRKPRQPTIQQKQTNIPSWLVHEIFLHKDTKLREFGVTINSFLPICSSAPACWLHGEGSEKSPYGPLDWSGGPHFMG